MTLTKRFRLTLIAPALLLGMVSAGQATAIRGGEIPSEEHAVVAIGTWNGNEPKWCSGVLWKPRLVLTSAGCVSFGMIAPRAIYVGEPGLPRRAGRMHYPIDVLIAERGTQSTPEDRSPELNQTTDALAILVFENDIAETDIHHLASKSEILQAATRNADADVVGYGMSGSQWPGAGWPTPQWVGPDQVTKATMRIEYPVSTDTSHLIIHGDTNTQPCSGDIGGAIVLQSTRGDRILAGIVSEEHRSCSNDEPQTTTRALVPLVESALLNRALAMAGYSPIPAEPREVELIQISPDHVQVKWSPPGTLSEYVVSYEVVLQDGRTLCVASSEQRSCVISSPLLPAGSVLVRAKGEQGDFNEATANVSRTRVIRPFEQAVMDVGSAEHVLVTFCTPSNWRKYILKSVDTRGIRRDVIPSVSSRSSECPVGRRFLTTFLWEPSPKSRIELEAYSMRIVGPGNHGVMFRVHTGQT